MKNKAFIKLNTVERAKKFIDIVSSVEPDLDIIVGRYVIDAKSIMGIFSIDLTRYLEFIIRSENEKECEEIMDKVKEFIV